MSGVRAKNGSSRDLSAREAAKFPPAESPPTRNPFDGEMLNDAAFSATWIAEMSALRPSICSAGEGQRTHFKAV